MEASMSFAANAAALRGGRRAARRTRALLGWVVCGIAVLTALVVVALAVGPRLLPYRTYAITGGSIAPTIPLGSEVIMRPVRADRLRVGDIITFHKPNAVHGLVTHRIVAVRGRGPSKIILTKGDANKLPDAWRIHAVGTGWRYAFSVPYLGYAVQLLATVLARFLALALLAIVLTAAGLRKLWQPPPS